MYACAYPCMRCIHVCFLGAHSARFWKSLTSAQLKPQILVPGKPWGLNRAASEPIQPTTDQPAKQGAKKPPNPKSSLGVSLRGAFNNFYICGSLVTADGCTCARATVPKLHMHLPHSTSPQAKLPPPPGRSCHFTIA